MKQPDRRRHGAAAVLLAICAACANPKIRLEHDGGQVTDDSPVSEPDADTGGQRPPDPEHDGSDGMVERPTDAGSDARVEPPLDGGSDAQVEGAMDAAMDGQVEVDLDAEVETGRDAEVEAARDAEVDAARDAEVEARPGDGGSVPDGEAPVVVDPTEETTSGQDWPHTYLRGQLTFDADFRRSGGGPFTSELGQIPLNSSAAAEFPLAFVCAMDMDGAEVDAEPIFGAGDDDVLGCARADRNGAYTINLRAVGAGTGREVYLVTWFCDQADEPVRVHGGSYSYPRFAQVCARMNVAGTTGRKFLHSPTYPLAYGTNNYLNWNVSCPMRQGGTDRVERVACDSVEAEPALTGSTHSNAAWNKEFAHVFRSAVELPKSMDGLTPTYESMAPIGCGPAGDAPCTPCDDAACRKHIDVVVAPAVVSDAATRCDPAALRNSATGFDEVCIVHGHDGRAGTLNPFLPVHELGHVLQARWMKDPRVASDHCPGTTWNGGNDEHAATAEAFANMVAISAWWNGSSATGVLYDGRGVEPGATSELVSTCGRGTACTCAEGELRGHGRPTRFFKQLFDQDDDDPFVDISIYDMLMVWSSFDQPEEVAECAPAGRNMQDFRDHFLALAPEFGWPDAAAYDALAAVECLDRHRRGVASCDEGVCP